MSNEPRFTTGPAELLGRFVVCENGEPIHSLHGDNEENVERLVDELNDSIGTYKIETLLKGGHEVVDEHKNTIFTTDDYLQAKLAVKRLNAMVEA
jgi:hypothetical protein